MNSTLGSVVPLAMFEICVRFVELHKGPVFATIDKLSMEESSIFCVFAAEVLFVCLLADNLATNNQQGVLDIIKHHSLMHWRKEAILGNSIVKNCQVTKIFVRC